MNKITTYALAALGVFFAIRFFRKAQTAKTLNIKIRTLKLSPISQASLLIDVINPTNTSISFTSVTGDLLLNSFAVATLNYQKPTTIESNSSMQIPLRIKINPVEFAQFTADRLLKKNKVTNLKFNGNVSGEGLNIPVNVEQPVNL